MAILNTERNGLGYIGDDVDVDTWLDYRNAFAASFQLIDLAIAKAMDASAIDPTANDDETLGYSTRSLFLTTTHKIFICEDPSVGAAVWRQIWPPMVADLSGDLGGSGTWALNVIPTGLMNGVNQEFTLPNTPTGGIMLSYQGQMLAPGAGKDYILSGATILLLEIVPNDSDNLLASYQY